MKIHLISLGKTIHDFNSKAEFIEFITTSLHSSEITTCYVLPEYAWGREEMSNIMEDMEMIQANLGPNDIFLLGTILRKDKDIWYNSAIIITRDTVRYVDKSNILEEEKSRGKIVNGQNSGVFEFNEIKIGVIICADIWDNELLNRLVKKEGAELLLVPAMTIVPKNYGKYARSQWYALALVRSREYLIPIVVADHHNPKNQEYDVGGASSITNPSEKREDMQTVESFLTLPKVGICRTYVNLKDVFEYRQYRIDKGLYTA